MANNLYVTEYAGVAGDQQGSTVGFLADRPVASQKVDFTAGVTPSAAFNAATRFIRVHAEAICSVKLGSAPVATAGDARMTAGQTEIYAVNPGDKISVITNT